MTSDLRTDRAEDQPLEAIQAAAPDDREVGIVGGLDERSCRIPSHLECLDREPALAQERSRLIEIVAPPAGLSPVEVGRDRDSAAGVRFGDRHDDDESPFVGERGGALKRALGRLGPVVADNDSRPAGALPNRGSTSEPRGAVWMSSAA